MTGLTGTRFLYNGMVLTVLSQASFISAYTMLIFLARLQRFDRAQEEAALDLGASHPQVFRHILLPFLRPAILSASVQARSEEHTSELQSLMRISYAVFCLKK